jgi:beta-phosphoglucomutase-like phosphatase (HAD superfamily)
MLDAVLLEWEGVLADTGGARRDALLRALADEGVPWTAAAYDGCCGGLAAHAAASAALMRAGIEDPTLVELVAKRASRAFLERLSGGFVLMPGAAEFVASAAHRTRVAIVTRAERAETELALGLAGLTEVITTIVTADTVIDPPPAPALYAHAVRRLSRRSASAPAMAALVDVAPSIRAARAGGVRTIAVGAAVHVAIEADAAVDGLRDLTVTDVATLVGIGSGRPA